MALKFSQYNFSVLYEGGFLVSNPITNAFVKFVGPDAQIVEKAMRFKDLSLLSQNLIVYLKQKGILRSIECDEYSEYQGILESYRHNLGHLDLTIMPTLRCNFRCIYCYENHEEIDMSNTTENAIIKFVEENIESYTGISVEWFGGEPLCALERIISLSTRLIEICKKHKKPYIAAMTSNGYLLTPNVFKQLLQINVNHFQITVDGLPEFHNRQKPFVDGSETFDVVMNNMIEICNMKRSGVYDISLRTNFTREMIDHATEFADYLAKYFSQNRHFGIFWRLAGDYGGDRVKLIKDSLINNLSALKDARIYAAKRGLQSPVNRDMIAIGGSVCYAYTYNSYIISPLGELMKCTANIDQPVNNIGYINSDGKMILNKNRELFLNAKQCENTECKNRPTCAGITCPMTVVLNHKTRCSWDDRNIIDEMKILSHSPFTVETYGGNT